MGILGIRVSGVGIGVWNQGLQNGCLELMSLEWGIQCLERRKPGLKVSGMGVFIWNVSLESGSWGV